VIYYSKIPCKKENVQMLYEIIKKIKKTTTFYKKKLAFYKKV